MMIKAMSYFGNDTEKCVQFTSKSLLVMIKVAMNKHTALFRLKCPLSLEINLKKHLNLRRRTIFLLRTHPRSQV